MKKAIGVFDSGFGGLNTLKSIVKELPEYNYIYLGDTARAPYGTKSQKLVYKYTRQAVNFLFKNGAELIVLACNTASSDALRKIQQKHLPRFYPDKRVLGVLIPAAELAEIKKHKRVGVMATAGTVRSGAYIRELTKLNPKIKVFQKACPLLVPIVEAGKQNEKLTDKILKVYLRPLLKKNVQAIILGCTHYGILENKIKNIVGKNTEVISEAEVVAEKLKDYLDRHQDVEKQLGKNHTVKFYSTGQLKRFQKLGSKFFGKKIKAKKAALK